jgi:pimeloyl-ACP methyl ester carboxylesterase
MTLIEPDAAIRVAGDWTHRDIYAHGARFHVVEQGEGPAVVLLHGFPTFWWTWRHQITALAEAGVTPGRG